MHRNRSPSVCRYHTETLNKNIPMHISACRVADVSTTRVRIRNSWLTKNTKTAPIIVVSVISVPNDGHLMALSDLCQLPRWHVLYIHATKACAGAPPTLPSSHDCYVWGAVSLPFMLRVDMQVQIWCVYGPLKTTSATDTLFSNPRGHYGREQTFKTADHRRTSTRTHP